MSDHATWNRTVSELKVRFGVWQALVIGLFVVLIAFILLVPDAASQQASDKNIYLLAIGVLLAYYVARLLLEKGSYQKTTDIFTVLVVLLLAWEVSIAKLAIADPFLFPSPAKVFAVFGYDYRLMLDGLFSSFTILFAGYFLALLVAMPLALWVGWRKRAFDVAYPIAKAVSPIPPTVYLPYSIVLLPTFRSASVFVIAIGAFWPVFVSTVYGVSSIDRRIINSAKALGLKERVMLSRIILPAALPSVFSGAMIALILSFITLTVAEMIAATSGLGWYIEYQHQFANNDKVIAGMLLMAACVIAVMWVFDRVQDYCLKWQRTQES
jgi:NitT/TauT family transport system permease protein